MLPFYRTILYDQVMLSSLNHVQFKDFVRLPDWLFIHGCVCYTSLSFAQLGLGSRPPFRVCQRTSVLRSIMVVYKFGTTRYHVRQLFYNDVIVHTVPNILGAVGFLLWFNLYIFQALQIALVTSQLLISYWVKYPSK